MVTRWSSLALRSTRGRSRAMARGGGGLKSFIVPPAQAETLDVTPASAGIPLVALDLRHAPLWFDQPRGSSQIGAVYPEGEPYAFVENIAPKDAFDALLFVDTTNRRAQEPRQVARAGTTLTRAPESARCAPHDAF